MGVYLSKNERGAATIEKNGITDFLKLIKLLTILNTSQGDCI